MNLKKMIPLAMSLMALFFSSFFSKGASVFVQKNDGPVIVLEQDPTDYGTEPRTIATNPFYAEYAARKVYLSASESIGVVTVEITSTTGDNYVTFFDTSDGDILLPVSGDSGYYVIRITVSATEHYIGRFEL